MKKYDFNKSANDYDSYYTSDFGKKVDEIEKKCFFGFMNRIKNKKVLEIGCGTGYWTEFFVQKGFSVTAIDIAEKMLEKAEKKNLKNVEFLKADVLQLPFKDNSFENIFAVTSLEFTENQPKAFSEIFRVLKKDGYLLVGGLNAKSELAEHKNENETFKNADFFTEKSMYNYLSKYGKPEIKLCLKIEAGKVFDNESVVGDYSHVNNTFIIGMVKKE